VKGRELRVNQLEIVDVDLAANSARGTLVTHLFNPRVTRYDLALEPRFANKAVDRRPETVGAETSGVATPPLQPPASSLQPDFLPSWLGVPGYGLGAMQGQHGQLASFDEGYQLDVGHDRIAGMPVEQWSTKSLIARWTGDVGATIDAALHPRGDDQLSGRLTNRTGLRLDDCVLAHGNWAYKLASLDDGEEVVITDDLPNATLKTTLTSVAAGDDPNARRAADGSVPYDALSTDVARIAKLMMFYDAIGGAAYASTPHRHLAYLDLSRLLRGDQAILIARAPAAVGSQWNETTSSELRDQRPARPLDGSHDNDRQWIYYRFVIPLTPEEVDAARPMIGPTQPGPSVGPQGPPTSRD
jgi:hypothetical protein